jgi:hypothetical protein
MKKFATLVSLVLFPFILGTAQVKDTISYSNVYIYNKDARFGDVGAAVAEQHTYTLDKSRKLRSFYYCVNKNSLKETHFFSYNNSGNMYKEIIYNSDKKAIYILKDYDANGNVVETKGYFLETDARSDSNNRRYVYDSKGRVKEELYLDASGKVKLQLRYKYNSSNDVVKTKIKGDARISEKDIVIKGKYSYNSSGKKTIEILKVKYNGESTTKQRDYFYNDKTALLDSVVIKDKDITYTKKMKYRDNGDIHHFAYFLDGKKVYQKTFNWFTNGKDSRSRIISR